MRLNGKQVRRVTVEKLTTTQNEYNESVSTWAADTSIAPGGIIFGEENNKGGDEVMESGQIIAWQKVLFKTKYFAALDPREHNAQANYRLKDGDVIYDIENIQVIARNKGLWIKCKARDNE